MSCSNANVTHIVARWALHSGVLLLCWTTAVSQTPLPRVVAAAGLPATAAQPNSSGSANGSDPTANTLETRLAEARTQLALVGDAGLTNAPAGVSPQEVGMRRALLHRLVTLYEQELSNVAALEKAASRKAETAREAQAWTRFTEPAPYSILLTDRLREELQAERQKIDNSEAAAAT